jgi:hypothetical protein
MSWRLLIAFLLRFSNRSAALSGRRMQKDGFASGKAIFRPGFPG